MITPSVNTLMQTKRPSVRRNSQAALRRRQRHIWQEESLRWFVIELLVFGVLLAVSILPMVHAVRAFRFL